ncbi:MAG: RDD family protein [Proteobacteria bacterium]|nr:RDD family protein [Pseudomonadota bacterium]
MEWYYSKGKEPVGPVSEAEFQSLVSSETINSNTLVWNQSMADWQKYKKVKTASNLPPTPAPADAPIMQKCSECGKSFSKDDLIQYEGFNVCANCKPLFVKKIKEGVATGDFRYGGFWIRYGAKFIDGLILIIPYFLIIFFMMKYLIPKGSPKDPLLILTTTAGPLLLVLFSVAYNTWFIGKYAATPGKMACGLKVITSDNEKVTYTRALGRYFAEMLSWAILLIGYLMAAFDSKKRSLHDRMCNTLVIRK